MPTSKPIVKPRQLVVEGRDAERFFEALLHELDRFDIQVQDYGGKDELPGSLKALRAAPGFVQVVSLGIVRDAETDPAATFQSACSALRNAKLTVPRQPEAIYGTSPRVSVLILPDAMTAGMLEDVCLQSVANHPAMSCVDEYFDCVSSQQGSLPSNMSKARVHAFLAARPKPDLLVGEAASAGYWPWDSQAFNHIKQFLHAL